MSAGLRWSGCEGALVADGQDPNTLLEGSIESLVPLWRWILWHLTPGNDAGGTAPGPVPRDVWPSWAGHTLGIA